MSAPNVAALEVRTGSELPLSALAAAGEPIAQNHSLILFFIPLIAERIFPVNVFREIACKLLLLYHKYRSETRMGARNA